MQIFICTAPSDVLLTGDVDYARAVVKTLNTYADIVVAKHISDRRLHGCDIVDQVLQAKKSNRLVIFQHMINVDRSGFMCTGRTVTADHLHQMQAAGVKVIISCIEYSKKCISGSPQVVARWDKFFEQTNHIVFVDELDKAAALEKSQVVKQLDDEGGVSIIRIPATLKELPFDQLKLVEDREANFINFGMIRSNKGILEYILPFAAKLKKVGSDKKVLIVGSVMHDSVNPSLVAAILIQCYGGTKSVNEAICMILERKLDPHSKAELLMDYYQSELKHREPGINVELHFDVPEVNLQSLFDRCRYALNFHYKGISPHFGGVTNTLLAQMKNYGLHLAMTPDYFLERGEYRALAVAFDPSDKRAIFDAILADTESLEARPGAYREFRHAFARFNHMYPIDISSVTASFYAVYQGLAQGAAYCRGGSGSELFSVGGLKIEDVKSEEKIAVEMGCDNKALEL